MNGRIVVVIVFMAIWSGVTGSLSLPNLLLGLGLGMLALWLVRDPDPGTPRVRLTSVVRLMLLFIVELLKSGWRVATLAVRPRLELNPAVIAYPLALTRDFEIALLANLITLTPGTLSVDVSADKETLYIHCVDVADYDAVVADIRDGFEARIREAFG